MNITFVPLTEAHFPLLLKWLEAPHVKEWWDQDLTYTPKLLEEKYGSYVNGYKLIDGIKKPMHAYIICLNEYTSDTLRFGRKTSIGYIQLYNAYDFPRDDKQIEDLPESLGAFDIFIGEKEYWNKGIGSAAIKIFTDDYVLSKYRYAFVDPEYSNESAVRAYEKAGFVIMKRVGKVFWMVAHKQIVRLSVKDSIALEMSFRKCFLKEDGLWIFGSRTDLTKKGGDIDLYIETNAKDIDEAIEMKSNFISTIEKAIGEQKIDVVLNAVNFPYPLPIYEIVKTEGVRII